MSTYYSCLILNEKPFFEVTNWVSEFATLDSIFTFPHSTSTIYLMVLSRVANLGPNLHIFVGSGFKTCDRHGYQKKIKSGSGLNIKSKLGQILNWVFFSGRSDPVPNLPPWFWPNNFAEPDLAPFSIIISLAVSDDRLFLRELLP